MAKRVVSLALALFLVLGATAFADALIANVNLDATYPIVNEPLAVTIAAVPQSASVNFTIENNWMAAYLNKVSGLDITWMLVDPAGAKERITLMLNSGDMPDAIQGYAFSTNDIVQYGVVEGLFHPLNDLLAYCPAFSKVLEEQPAVRAAITATDGNIYGFPALSNIWNYPLRFFVDTTWLEAAGVENPHTLAEFKDMLAAFRDLDVNGNGDAGDEIPWAGSWNEQFSERNFILNAYGYVNNGSGNIAIDYSCAEPVIVYIPYAAQYKDYLLYMNGLWNEGLMDPDMFTQAEAQVQATVLEGTIGFCGMSAPYVYDPDRQDLWDSINVLVDQEGDTPVFPGPNVIFTTSMMSLSVDCEDEVAAALANYADAFYTLEVWAQATFGPEAGSELDYFGTGHYLDEETRTIQYNMPADMTSAWTHRVTYLSFWNVPGMNQTGYDPYRLEYAKVYPDSAIGQFYKDGIVNRRDEDEQQQKQSPYYVENVPALFFAAEDLERINELVTPLDDYAASMESKFITGALSIEENFDAFIQTLKDYGVDEYLAIYTRYYEAYKAN